MQYTHTHTHTHIYIYSTESLAGLLLQQIQKMNGVKEKDREESKKR